MTVLAALLLAACGGGGDETTEPEAQQTESPAGDMQTEAPAADVVLVGTASFEFQPSEVEAAAGTVSVAFTSEGGPHTFTLELEDGVETVAQSFSPGETDVGEIQLEAGTYTFYCAVLDHRAEGMEGVLTVS
jgi:plastocyanin